MARVIAVSAMTLLFWEASFRHDHWDRIPRWIAWPALIAALVGLTLAIHWARVRSRRDGRR